MIVATADSNIYVSALQFGGVPLEFVTAARSAAFRLAISEPIIAEVRGVLQNKFRWSADIVDEALSGIREFTHLVVPSQSLRVIAEDPDDDRVIECAIASESQFIVSGDKHLLRLVQYQNVRILKVSDFLTLVPKPSL